MFTPISNKIITILKSTPESIEIGVEQSCIRKEEFECPVIKMTWKINIGCSEEDLRHILIDNGIVFDIEYKSDE